MPVTRPSARRGLSVHPSPALQAASEAFSALEVELRTRFVVVQASQGYSRGAAGFAKAPSYQGFDHFFSVSLAAGVAVQAPVTADLVQLGSGYILQQLQSVRVFFF